MPAGQPYDLVVTIPKKIEEMTPDDMKRLLILHREKNEIRSDKDREKYYVDIDPKKATPAQVKDSRQALETGFPAQQIDRDILQLKNDKRLDRSIGFVMGAATVIGLPLVFSTVREQAKQSPQTPALNYTIEGVIIGMMFLGAMLTRRCLEGFLAASRQLTQLKTEEPKFKKTLNDMLESRIAEYNFDPPDYEIPVAPV